MAGFIDGIKSFVNDLANTRNPLNTNTLMNERGLSDSTIRAAFKTGIHNKAIRLKTGHALKNTIKFDSTADREYFEKRLAPHVKKAVAGVCVCAFTVFKAGVKSKSSWLQIDHCSLPMHDVPLMSLFAWLIENSFGCE